VKVVYFINFPNLEALHNRKHVYFSSVYQKEFGSSYTTFKRHCERQHKWGHSSTHTMTFSTPRQLLLNRLHSHSLSLPQLITCSLSVTVTMSLSHSLEFSLKVTTPITDSQSITVTIWTNYWLELKNWHYLNESVAAAQPLSLSQWITDSYSTTVNISNNHWFLLNHCHCLNESLTRTQPLSPSQGITES
jgi:hypothetical protein